MCHVVATCDCVCKRLRHPLPCNISYILHAGLSFVNNWQCQHIAACTAPSTTQPILLVYMTHAAYVSQCMQWLSFSVPIPPSVSSLTKLNSQLVGPAVIHHPAYYSASTPCSNGAGPVLLQPEHTPAWPATKHNGKLLHFSSRPPSMWSVRLPPHTHTPQWSVQLPHTHQSSRQQLLHGGDHPEAVALGQRLVAWPHHKHGSPPGCCSGLRRAHIM